MERTAGRRNAVVSAAILAICVAGLGALATEIGPWYRNLAKPEWIPPDWAFGAGWTFIFACAALSAAHAWHLSPGADVRRQLLTFFGINGALNILWSVLFFRLRRPDWALMEVGFLWLSVLVLIVFLARKRCYVSALLLLPYLVWVTLAGTLNWQVVQLNPSF